MLPDRNFPFQSNIWVEHNVWEGTSFRQCEAGLQGLRGRQLICAIVQMEVSKNHRRKDFLKSVLNYWSQKLLSDLELGGPDDFSYDLRGQPRPKITNIVILQSLKLLHTSKWPIWCWSLRSNSVTRPKMAKSVNIKKFKWDILDDF